MMEKFFRDSYKILVGIVFGVLLYVATTVAGSSVTYSYKSFGLSSTDVRGVIDELYNKAENLGKVRYEYGDLDKVTSYTDYMELVSGYNKRIFIAKDSTQKLVNYHV